ncbi:Protein AIR2 like protein [Verticillium longisporum]|uniref:Protein AIR2 like protein n=1 Tax=Verticillium longisporum TaxID=100787 RepID=A0A8I2Z5E6_VERLO|nr:Protein AIR2 like protein [Verticillium longisporum]
MDASDEAPPAVSSPAPAILEAQQPSKKRSREVSEEAAPLPAAPSPEPESKRQKTAQPSGHEPAMEVSKALGNTVTPTTAEVPNINKATSGSASNTNNFKGGKKTGGKNSAKTFTDETGQHFLLPTDPKILRKKQAADTWHERITRWINAVVEQNKDKGPLMTPSLCIDMFAHAQSKEKESKTALHRIKKLQKGGKLDTIVGLALEAVHGPGVFAAGTSQDPISIGDHGEAEDAEEDGEDTGSGDEETDNTTRPSTSVPSGAASIQGDDDAKQQESAPTASDWASLLGPEAGSAAGQSAAKAKGGDNRSTQHDEPEVAGYRQVMSEDEAEKEQQRYFPGATEICTICAATGHTCMACPNTLCQFCRGDHFSWNCPGRSRCAKCRQFGHTKSKCKEKLAMALEEGLECAFCGEGDHLENACDNVWHSYHLQRESMHTVRYIAAFCSYCGCEGHYSSDCPAGDQQPFPQKWTATWSLKDRDLCVDANATDESIARFGVAAESNDPGMHVRGAAAAAKRTHIFYSDSDGSEEGEFLSEKVKPRAAPGQMRMSTNIQFNSTMPSTAFAGQPPLPPGPPPPGPPPGNPGSYSRMATSYGAQSHALPPRPPAPGQPPSGPGAQRGGYHNVPPPKGPATQPKNKAKGKNIPQSNKKRAAMQQQQQQPQSQGSSQQQNGSRANQRRGNGTNRRPRRGGKQG